MRKETGEEDKSNVDYLRNLFLLGAERNSYHMSPALNQILSLDPDRSI